VLAPRWILALFGSGFTSGSTSLAILAGGQFVNVVTGSVGFILMMCGYEKLMRNTILGIALLNMLLNFLLIPWFGVNGAAIATAVSLALMNLILVFIVYRKLKIMTLPIPVRLIPNGK
jgi:O-antigen/teichoic acid export membrane protein